ncbi:MAG: sensor histidine kinase [Ferruginibacter sp.]
MRIIITILLAFSFLYGCSQPGNSSILSFSKSSKITEGYYFADSTCALGFRQVNDPGFSKNFRRANLEKIPLQENIDCYWVKCNIVNAAQQNKDWMLEFDGWKVVEVYSTDSNSAIKKQLTGHVVPVEDKDFVHANRNLTHLTLKAGDSVMVIAKLVTGVDYMRQPSDLSVTVRSFLSEDKNYHRLMYFVFFFAGIYVVMFLYNLFIYFSTGDKSYPYYLFLIFFSLFALLSNTGYSVELLRGFRTFPTWATDLDLLLSSLFGINIIFFTRSFLKTKITTPVIDKIFNYLIAALVMVILPAFFGMSMLATNISSLLGMITTTLILVTSFKAYKKGYPSSGIFLAANGFFMVSIFIYLALTILEPSQGLLSYYSMPIGAAVQIVLFSFALGNKINVLKRENDESQQKLIYQLQQYNELQEKVNQELEHKVEVRTKELRDSQKQMLQQEKLASLGELTAGIAHEIQNPLNFIKNFTELSGELVQELKDEVHTSNGVIDQEVLNDLLSNTQKINGHVNRIDSIVKGMMEHTRGVSTDKEIVDVNTACDEYLSYAYHGYLAKEKHMLTTIVKHYDPEAGSIKMNKQGMRRALHNVLNNAFYAVDQKKYDALTGEKPTITLTTERHNGNVQIKVHDNGCGIGQKTINKIFQPFFTTKPTGKGVGLGLSISYEIVQEHNGQLTVETEEGKYSTFTISLPA